MVVRRSAPPLSPAASGGQSNGWVGTTRRVGRRTGGAGAGSGGAAAADAPAGAAVPRGLAQPLGPSSDPIRSKKNIDVSQTLQFQVPCVRVFQWGICLRPYTDNIGLLQIHLKPKNGKRRIITTDMGSGIGGEGAYIRLHWCVLGAQAFF